MKNQQQNNMDHLKQNVAKEEKNNVDTSAVYLGDSSMQTKDEFEKAQKTDHTKEDNKITFSGDDPQSKSDNAYAGTDRAGTAERKKYGDIELNKGLEAQAKDEES